MTNSLPQNPLLPQTNDPILPAQKKLDGLAFVDLYLCLEGNGRAHYRASMKGISRHPDIAVPLEFREDLIRLTKYIKEKANEDWSMVEFEGVRMRAAFFKTSNGQKWVALRKVKDLPPALDTLGLPLGMLPHLRMMGKFGGLILVCGATGQGKTTTCCSLFLEYLKLYGGIGFTIEDPAEYNLGGRHGESGYCFQVEVQEDHEWAEQLRSSLRCHPKYIFIGEVVTPEVANQLLRAATSGHTVIATVHGGNLQEGLEGILQLAEQVIGDRAKQLLASCLLGIFYQTLGQFGVNLRFIFTDTLGFPGSVRGLIRDSQIGQINTLADQQQAQLQQGTLGSHQQRDATQ